MKFQTLNKKAMGCMYAATGLGTMITAAVLTFAMYYFSLFSHPILKAVYGALLLLLAFNGICSPPFRYRRYRYAIDQECIDVREGYLWSTEHIVPVERLHQVALQRGPIDWVFGLTKVMVVTAGGEVTIRFLEYEKAQDIAESLKQKINQIAIAEHAVKKISQEEPYEN